MAVFSTDIGYLTAFSNIDMNYPKLPVSTEIFGELDLFHLNLVFMQQSSDIMNGKLGFIHAIDFGVNGEIK